jgi:hypothetical protein
MPQETRVAQGAAAIEIATRDGERQGKIVRIGGERTMLRAQRPRLAITGVGQVFQHDSVICRHERRRPRRSDRAGD